jgi:iron complex outermembrane receptor protein
MGGLRLANLSVDYTENGLVLNGFGPVLNFKTDETKLLPRGGVVVELFDGVSVFGSYSQGMRWAGFGVQSDPTNTAPAPEESEQFEAGAKFDLANGLSGTVAVFEINRTNVPVVLAIGNTINSEQRSRGFEADLLWQANENWQVLASYGYVDAVFASAAGFVPAGNKIANVPEHSGRFWVNYAFDPGPLKGWSVGAGVYASSGQFVDNFNVFETESYFTVDAKVGYETETFSAALNIKNLTDEDYFVPYPWFGGQVSPGADRAYFGTLVYRY